MKISNKKVLKFFGFVPNQEHAFVDQPLDLWIKCLIWKYTGIKGFCWKHFRFKTAKLFKWQPFCFECWIIPKPATQVFLDQAIAALPRVWQDSLETKVSLISVKPLRAVAANPWFFPMTYSEESRTWTTVRSYSARP